MGNPWYPGATVTPGEAAGYAKGHNAMRAVVVHYTVGVTSDGVGLRGYFNFLVRRNGEVIQFAEVDALTWHAGSFNSQGPGIEHEFYEPTDGPAPENILTTVQSTASGKLCHWLNVAHGIPLDFYDGLRISAFNGFITHRSVRQSDPHSDYITRDQWNAAIGGTAPDGVDWAAILQIANNRKRFPMWLIRDTRTGGIYLESGGRLRLLDPVGLSVQQAKMAQLGLPNAVINGQDYIVDRYKGQGLCTDVFG